MYLINKTLFMRKTKLQINLFIKVFTLVLFTASLKVKSQDILNENNYYQLFKNKYINKFEITNKAYSLFLENYSGKISKETISIKNYLWTDNELNIPSNRMYKDLYHSTKKWENHPVVNITQEAAKTYCKWLTEQYNSNPEREFKKVVFRLPTEKEWLKAYKKIKNK